MWSRSTWSFVTFLVMFAAFIQIPHEVFAQECELNCKGTCSAGGQCICDQPPPDSIMMGERQFKTGSCIELVQGENYTCQCLRGFAGEHCELVGLHCGDIYCYNNGTCAPGLGSCQCPEEFLGSRDCSVPTLPEVETPSSDPPASSQSGKHSKVWLVGVAIALILVSCVFGLAVRCYRQRVRKLSQSRFHELQHVHLNDEADLYDDVLGENGKTLR